MFFLKTFTSSFYAVDTWTFDVSNLAVQKLSVAHHIAVKRKRWMTPLGSNHDACLTMTVNIFRHLFAKRRVSFAFAARNSGKTCLVPLRYYLRWRSAFSRQTVDYFRVVSEIPYLFDIPLCAIGTMFDFVERDEPLSGHMR